MKYLLLIFIPAIFFSLVKPDLSASGNSAVPANLITNNKIMEEYYRSCGVRAENPFIQIPERILIKKVVRFKISRTS